MDVGVLDMYPDERGSWYLIKAIIDLGFNPVVFQMRSIILKRQSLYKIIGRSGIKKWVFSGSPQAVHDKSSIKIPMNVFKLPNREFLLICYSMESVLHQLGIGVVERYENKKEYFNLYIQKTKAFLFDKEYLFSGIKNPLCCWRNHHWYTVANKLEHINELASYRGELMIAFYKHLLFTQLHPERSADGKKFLMNWLNGQQIA